MKLSLIHFIDQLVVNLSFQASVGPCNIPEPSSWKIVEHSKWARFVCFNHACFFPFSVLLLYFNIKPLSSMDFDILFESNMRVLCSSSHHLNSLSSTTSKIYKWGPMSFNGEMMNITLMLDSNMRGFKTIFYMFALIWNSGFAMLVQAFILLCNYLMDAALFFFFFFLMLYFKLYLQYELVHSCSREYC